jgi:hypothetical protein
VLAIEVLSPQINGDWVWCCSFPWGPLADTENKLRNALGGNVPPPHQNVLSTVVVRCPLEFDHRLRDMNILLLAGINHTTVGAVEGVLLGKWWGEVWRT